MKRTYLTTSAIFVLLGFSVLAQAKLSTVPEPFKGASADSTYTIKYDDVNELLKRTVVNTGRSTRERAEASEARTGTRMRVTIKRATANEGNRFHFEVFQGDDEAAAILNQLKTNLETIPDQVELAAFSRNEQLAYWLNLYNITILEELINIYPKNKLKKYLTGKRSILNKNVLTVAGIDLSLNDIKFILRENYKANPMVIYGLYQGIVGGPNIRRVAYTGSNVHAALQDNAEEFVNSNRGSYSSSKKTFRVSSLYERDEVFFPTDEALRKHLTGLLQSPELEEFQAASQIKANIDDWAITDLYGSSRELGGSLASSKAALLDSMNSSQPGDSAGQSVNTNFSAASSSVIGKNPRELRFSPDLLVRLQEVNARREMTLKGSGTVTVEELGTVESTPQDPDKIGDQ